MKIPKIKAKPLSPKSGQVRRYKGARPTRLARFTTSDLTRMEANRLDLMGMVRHSRFLAENNDYFRSFQLMCRRHIPGPQGIRLRPMAMNAVGRLDKPDNTLHSRVFKQWSKRGNCTVCGRFSLVDVQHQVAMMTPRDGGFFVRHFMGRQYGPFGYQFQILTIDRLALDMMREFRDGGYINGGVECDADDRVLAYHFYRHQPGSQYRRLGETIRIPANDITYVGVIEDYSTHLAMPWGFTAVSRLNGLEGFEEAALTAARAGAAKMGFYSAPHADIDQSADDPTLEEIEAGQIEKLPAGWDFKQFDPGYPDGESPLFVKLMLRGAAAGMGASYNGLAGDLEGTNFSSLHVGRDEERNEWRIHQHWFAEHFLDVIHEKWLPMAIVSNQLPFPMSKLEKFREVSWKGRGWVAVDPVKQSNADIADIGAGLNSPQRVVEARGGDYQEILQEIAEARDLARESGLTFDPKLIPINVLPASDESQ